MKNIIGVLSLFLIANLHAQFSGGTGTALDPYQISNKIDLKTLSENSIYWDKHFVQTSNIGFVSADYAPGGDFYNNDSLFSPIGYFSGSYNGQYYTIDSLKINRPTIDGVGLFGNITNAIISNLGLTNTDITGHNYVGSLVGSASWYCTISNTHCNGNVIGYETVGGLVGALIDSSYIIDCHMNGNIIGQNVVGGLVGGSDYYSEINNSHSTGTVEGHEYTGGLAGSIGVHANVKNSYASCNITASYYHSGGLIGILTSYSNITNSYATGNVNGYSIVGGLIGGCDYQCNITYSCATGNTSGDGGVGGLIGTMDQNSIVSNSYARGNVTGNFQIGGLIGAAVNSNVSNSYSTGIVNGSVSVGGLVGYNNSATTNNSYWDLNTSGQPTSSGGTGKTTTEMQTQSTFTAGNWDFVGESIIGTNDYWMMPGCTGVDYPILSWQLFSGGLGTLTDPFLIGTKTGLKNLCETTCLWDKHFKQMNHIQFNSSDFSAGGDFYNGGAGFSPIGNDVINFTGSYNGQNYFIDSLYINRNSSDYIGLFGFTNGASLNKTNLTNVNLTGAYYVGGLAGRCDATVIDTCSSSGNINCTGQSGGLVGMTYVASEITGSHSSVNLLGDAELGGLVGRNENNSIIHTSFATGSITGNAYRFGGLVALNNSSAIISNSYATGSVDGSSNVGGLVGSAFASSSIINSYSTGAVSGSSNIGGLLGSSSSSTTTNSFWDVQTSGQSISAGGTGKTTIQMQTETTFTSSPADWDFVIETTNGTNDYWKMGNCATNHGYPVFANQTLNVVVIPPTPVINAGGATTFCEGDSVSITSTIGDNYLWSNGATTNGIQVLNSDSITVQIISASGCVSNSSNLIVVSVNPAPGTPTINASGNTTFCNGGSVTINSTTGDNYIWNTGSTSNSIVVSNSDTVYVQIESTEGCMSDTSNMIIISEIDCSGVEDVENAITIYPNPTSDFIMINTNGIIENIKLYDALGHLIGSYSNQNIINVSLLNSGIYLMEVNLWNKTFTRRVVIK